MFFVTVRYGMKAEGAALHRRREVDVLETKCRGVCVQSSGWIEGGFRK